MDSLICLLEFTIYSDICYCMTINNCNDSEDCVTMRFSQHHPHLRHTYYTRHCIPRPKFAQFVYYQILRVTRLGLNRLWGFSSVLKR